MKGLSDNSEKIEMATAFDAIWAIMLALKEASIALQNTSTPLEYNVEELYGSDDVTKAIKSKLRNVSFEGLTVIVSYTYLFFEMNCTIRGPILINCIFNKISKFEKVLRERSLSEKVSSAFQKA